MPRRSSPLAFTFTTLSLFAFASASPSLLPNSLHTQHSTLFYTLVVKKCKSYAILKRCLVIHPNIHKADRLFAGNLSLTGPPRILPSSFQESLTPEPAISSIDQSMLRLVKADVPYTCKARDYTSATPPLLDLFFTQFLPTPKLHLQISRPMDLW